MPYEFLIPIGYAIGGQLGRAVLGILKAIKNEEHISLKLTVLTLIESAVIGFIYSFFSQDPGQLLLVGFTGTDVLDSITELARRD